jgi:hypothetical protein
LGTSNGAVTCVLNNGNQGLNPVADSVAIRRPAFVRPASPNQNNILYDIRTLTDFTECGFGTEAPYQSKYIRQSGQPSASATLASGRQTCGTIGTVNGGGVGSATLIGDSRTFDFYRGACLSDPLLSTLPRYGAAGTTTPAFTEGFGNSLPNGQNMEVTYTFQGVCKASPWSQFAGGVNIQQQGAGITWTLQGASASTSANVLVFFPKDEDPEDENPINNALPNEQFDGGLSVGNTAGTVNVDRTTYVNSAPDSGTSDIFWTINRESTNYNALTRPKMTVANLGFVDGTFDRAPATRQFQGTMFFVGDGELILNNVVFEGFDSDAHYTKNIAGSGTTGTLVLAPSLIQSQCAVDPAGVDNAGSACLVDPLSPLKTTDANAALNRPKVTLTDVTVRSRAAVPTFAYQFGLPGNIRSDFKPLAAVDFTNQNSQRQLFFGRR